MKELFFFTKGLMLLGYFLFLHIPLYPEGTKELNSNNLESTKLYLCNDFTNHCSGSNGVRSQFATFDNTQSAADVDRLYFVVQNTDEVVYMGFRGGSLTSPSNPARHIVYRIKNLAGTIVQAEQNLPTTGTGFINSFTEAVNGPDQLILPPLPATGYTAHLFDPPAIGTYYIEFSVRRNDNNNFYTGTFTLDLIDITVANTITQLAKPGRVYSKSWQFSEDDSFYGKNYIISDDSIVTSAQFTGMQGGSWVQYCNQTGCGNSSATWITSRKSIYQQQALFPQYKIFLNNPDPQLFPAATTLGQIVAPQPYGVQNCLTGHILFHVNVNKPGNAEITLNFPSPYQPRVLNQAVTVGQNLFDWDGLDGTLPTGLVVPNNTVIQFIVKYINGLTNLPLYDVEGNTNGFTVALVNPVGASPAVYWDDTNIPGGANNSNPPGCTSPPGCHTWSSGGSGWGNLNTINSWWYNVSTSTAPVNINEFRGPLALVFNQSYPYIYCANTGGHIFSVTPDPNTDVYHWSYTPPAGVTITQATPGSALVSISFGAGASSGVLHVYGTNTNCAMNGPTTSIPITINPVPVPTLTGPTSVCAGQTNVTYTTEAGKSNYQWNVPAGGTITAGGTTSSNTVTITWNSAGARSVSVSYQSGTPPCTPVAPTVLPVTVNARPVPGLNGLTLVCIGSSGIIYSTESGKQNYIWTVSSGGTITAGGTSSSNTVTVTWNTIGIQAVSVSYTDPVTLCMAAMPTQLNVNVNSLPIPSLSAGATSVCLGMPGNLYMTEAGMSNYQWIVTGGVITSGGNPASNIAVVTWNSTGMQSISVNYTIPFSSCTAPIPTVLPVNVNALPTPQIISGSNSVCVGIPGLTYNADPGKQNYVWNVVGGFITAGGGLNHDFVTVTWTVTGNQSLSVNYTDPVTYCTAAVPTVYPVTVKPLPQPSVVTGSNSVCLNSSGNVYTTQPGMSNYLWNITGGVITEGGNADDNSITITWTIAGDQTISYNYTDPATQCTAVEPAVFTVNVKPLPQPVLTSPDNSVCQLSGNHVYSTQAGMLDYSWQITGGTITSGGTFADETATVTWNVVGDQTISAGYTDPLTQCTAETPAVFHVEVKPLPVPEITGPSPVCLNAPGPQYSTAGGMSNYSWTLTGGAITGSSLPEIVDVTWNVLGVQTIVVTYTALNGCNPASPAQKTIQVNDLPEPVISGPGTVCSGVPVNYSTESGMSGYTWTITGDHQVISGGNTGDPVINIIWTDAGTHAVSVNYILGTGCTAAIPTVLQVVVNPTPHPAIAEDPPGRNCVTFQNSYHTEPAMTNYQWTHSGGGTLLSASTGSQINIQWNNTGPQWVKVDYTNSFGCVSLTPAVMNVNVNPLPVTIISPASGPECESLAHNYQSMPDPQVNFQWSVIPTDRGLVESGQGTNNISVVWQSAGTANLSVTGLNNNTGCYASSAIAITVFPSPDPVFVPCFDLVTTPYAQKIILYGASPYLEGQGIYSGNRVSLNTMTGFYEFDPFGASTGSYPIVYTYTNTYGCPASAHPVSISVQNVSFSCGGNLNDVRDGKSYPTVLVGGKCWMAANLDHGIELGWLQPATDNCLDEKACMPADPQCIRYGGFYQWNELMRYGRSYNSQGICPPEWHVPSASEWTNMLYALGTGVNPPDGVAGSFLKDTWLAGGLKTLTPGLFYLDNAWSFTDGSLTGSMFWTSTPEGPYQAVARGVNSANPSNSKYSGNRQNSFSVRCVKDQ